MREKLAEYAHAAWSGWMEYLFEKSAQNADGTVTIPAWAVSRWQRQMNTPYEALPASEKESDGVEADRMIAIMSSHLTKRAPDLPKRGEKYRECPCCGSRLLVYDSETASG